VTFPETTDAFRIATEKFSTSRSGANRLFADRYMILQLTSSGEFGIPEGSATSLKVKDGLQIFLASAIYRVHTLIVLRTRLKI
jgi:hypothetical protein